MMRLQGYAALFDQETVIGGLFREVIRPGAFRASLQRGADVRCLWNHDPNHILGRTTAGTLLVEEDARGLRYVVDVPAAHQGVVESVQRRDVTQSSFAFRIIRERWTLPTTRGELPFRELLEVDVYDVAPVTFPAYDHTTVSVPVRP